MHEDKELRQVCAFTHVRTNNSYALFGCTCDSPLLRMMSTEDMSGTTRNTYVLSLCDRSDKQCVIKFVYFKQIVIGLKQDFCWLCTWCDNPISECFLVFCLMFKGHCLALFIGMCLCRMDERDIPSKVGCFQATSLKLCSHICAMIVHAHIVFPELHLII